MVMISSQRIKVNICEFSYFVTQPTRDFIFNEAASCQGVCFQQNQLVKFNLLTYSKTCLKRQLKNRQNKDLNDGNLMKVESIAECSPWSIL